VVYIIIMPIKSQMKKGNYSSSKESLLVDYCFIMVCNIVLTKYIKGQF